MKEAGQKVQSIKRKGHYRNRDNDLFYHFSKHESTHMI